MRKMFTFEVWYFKDSGKFYAGDQFRLETRFIQPHSSLMAQPIMDDAVDYIKAMNRKGRGLPGLVGGWTGPIVINHPDGFPCLIPGEADVSQTSVPEMQVCMGA